MHAELLAASGFVPANGGQNADSALFALAVLYAWVPVALKIVAIGLMWNFPLSEEVQRQLRGQIEASTASPDFRAS